MASNARQPVACHVAGVCARFEVPRGLSRRDANARQSCVCPPRSGGFGVMLAHRRRRGAATAPTSSPCQRRTR
eukprot:1102374-Prymnesium_polylepis.2